MRHVLGVLIPALWGASALLMPSGAHAEDSLTLESVDGDQAVVVFDGKTQQPRPGKKGDEVHFWDVIQTSPRAAAKIRYPDGSLVVVGRDTKFTIQPQQQGTQYNELSWGQVRAQVEKPTQPVSPKAPPRFVIRTKTAVMGVRGTDFVAGFDAASGHASLHTIEGAVDVGASENQVLAWQGTPVTAGHEASLGPGLPRFEVKAFAAQTYKEQIKTEQPELVALADRSHAEGEAPADSASSGADKPPASVQPVRELKQKEPESESPLSLLNFRIGALSLYQPKGQYSGIQYTTGVGSWTPSYRFGELLGVGGLASAFAVKNGDTGKTFPVLKGGGVLDLAVLGAIHLEGGGGIEYWLTDTQGTQHAFFGMANVAWRFAPGKWIDTIYAGASQVIGVGGDVPIEAYAGVGVRF